jgi:flagellin-like protein
MRAWHRNRRGVSNLLAVMLLVAITIILVAFLYAFKPPVPQASSSLYYSTQGGLTLPTFGDSTDCVNILQPSTCSQLQAVQIVFTTQSPGTMPIGSLQFFFLCNGTVYLQSTLPHMLYIPTTSHSVNANCVAGENCLGKCGVYDPGQVFGHLIPFNRLGFFWQLVPNATYLQDGDSIILYIHSPVAPHDCSSSGCSSAPDTDDYHGIPPWCFASPGGAPPASSCSIQIVYTGSPASTVLTIPVSALAVPA